MIIQNIIGSMSMAPARALMSTGTSLPINIATYRRNRKKAVGIRKLTFNL